MAEDTTEIPITNVDEKANKSSTGSQLTKLKDANAKYKKLLNMAKERIQTQEEELEALREEAQRLKEQLLESDRNDAGAANKFSMDETDHQEGDPGTLSIVRVCQRVKEVADDDMEEIWALLEWERETETSSTRSKKWRRFDTESELKDLIRRDTGEPLTLPPYSLTADQSSKIQEEARQSVSEVTEEFRRFRVRAQVQKKQAEGLIRDLQSSNVQTAKRRIEGEDLVRGVSVFSRIIALVYLSLCCIRSSQEKELEQARTDHAQLELLKTEMAAQEAQWKEAYDVLMTENNSLKSSGSEALLAAQWRQRYETCLAEKEDLTTRLQMEVEKSEAVADQRRKVDAGKYEMKYRDLKESFRLYRKKAKEIFEAQQRGDVGVRCV